LFPIGIEEDNFSKNLKNRYK